MYRMRAVQVECGAGGCTGGVRGGRTYRWSAGQTGVQVECGQAGVQVECGGVQEERRPVKLQIDAC